MRRPPAHLPAAFADTAADAAARPRWAVDGATFALDEPEHVPAVWGQSEEVLWSAGEPLLLTGPPGVGKTTLLQQLVLARIGIGSLEVAGHLVTPDPDRRVLYLAHDRPRQIARSLRRMVTERDRRDLAARLVVCVGPPPFNVVDEPGALADLAAELDAGTVFVDSLKDLASPLSEERVGTAVSAALAACVARGTEVAASHHQRKATGDNRKPTKLDDVYGSAWLAAGAGSVLLLWGEPGDALVELRHLKQPADVVGPLQLEHDHARGRTTALDRRTARDVLRTATQPLTAKQVASLLHDTGQPDRAQIARARRKLDALVKDGTALREDGHAGANPKGAEYRIADPGPVPECASGVQRHSKGFSESVPECASGVQPPTHRGTPETQSGTNARHTTTRPRHTPTRAPMPQPHAPEGGEGQAGADNSNDNQEDEMPAAPEPPDTPGNHHNAQGERRLADLTDTEILAKFPGSSLEANEQ